MKVQSFIRGEPLTGPGIAKIGSLAILLLVPLESISPERLADVKGSLRDGYLCLRLRGLHMLTIAGGELPTRLQVSPGRFASPGHTNTPFRDVRGPGGSPVECDAWEWVGTAESCAVVGGILSPVPSGLQEWRRAT